jgi:hypothetical protein
MYMMGGLARGTKIKPSLLGYIEASYVEKATIGSESNVWMRILI